MKVNSQRQSANKQQFDQESRTPTSRRSSQINLSINKGSALEAANRIEKLEQVVNMLCQKTDQIIPLINKSDQKGGNENTQKTILLKQKEHEDKLQKIEQTMQDCIYNVEQLQKGLKDSQDKDSISLEKQIGKIQIEFNKRINERENKNLIEMQSCEIKVMDQIMFVQRKLEIENQALDKKITKFQTDFMDYKIKEKDEWDKMKEFLNKNKMIGDSNETIKNIEKNFEKKIQELQEQVQLEVTNIWRDIGFVICQQSLILDDYKKQSLTNYINLLPKELDQQEKILKVNIIEQNYLVDEINRFNTENTQRLVYEFKDLDDRLLKLENQLAGAPKSSQEHQMLLQDLEIEVDLFFSLQNQLIGAKKKCVFDMKKIEEKLEKLEFIKSQFKSDLLDGARGTRIKADIKTVDSYYNNIEEIKYTVKKNLKTLNEQASKVNKKQLQLFPSQLYRLPPIFRNFKKDVFEQK